MLLRGAIKMISESNIKLYCLWFSRWRLTKAERQKTVREKQKKNLARNRMSTENQRYNFVLRKAF